MKTKITLIVMASVLIIAACKKKETEQSVDPRIPPDMVLKTGGNYIFKDTVVQKLDTILMGVIITKTEDNLTSFNASYSLDGATSTTTFFNHQCLSSEYTGYTTDVTYYTRNQAGSEKIILSVVDRDGNITKKSIVLTVQ
jgi:hypothetical protein